MTEEEVKQYINLNNKFIDRCNEIAQIMKRWNYSYGFIDNWSLDGNDSVYGTGDEYWSYGGHESHYVSFDVDWLTKTDEELNEIADTYIEEEKQRQEQEKRAEEEKKRERELAELKRLQEKYKV